MNYYNEHDTKAAAWLRELITAKLIPNGDVDERSITEVQPDELRQYTQCHFFAGIGGWSYALQLAGWPADRPVWTGSCPCQPFSAAGKGLGDKDERHLWPVFFNLIKECRPEHVFGEQVASAIGKGWLDGISSDLESEGYAVGATVLGAHSVGAPHIRQRLYWLADSQSGGLGIDGSASREAGHTDQCSETIGLAHTCGNGRDQGGQCQPTEGGDGAFRDSAASRLVDSNMHGSDEEESRCCNETEGVSAKHWSGIDVSRMLERTSATGGGLADADGEQAITTDAGGLHSQPCGGGGMVNTIEQGLQGHNRPADVELHRGEGSERSTGPTGFWDQYDIIPCRDGKSRRIECQSRRLADGIPALLDDLRDAGATEEQIEAAINPFPLVKKQLGRTILLKGYGNAIVPQVAAEFIKAFLES